MKELSLNILDIAENSVKAGASLTEIILNEESDTLTMTVRDNGSGMSEETLRSVTDPFYTTRTTRKVGLGIPLLKLACEQTGGTLTITSRLMTASLPGETTVTAIFNTAHIDATPLGDVISTVVTLIQGHPNRDFYFLHKKGSHTVELDTRALREVLEDVPLSTPDVLVWVRENLEEQYKEFII
ncbi:MAG: sensor histidine kinase [Clostridia bacterium]|nr:sensor histidine kinase [Clostridia bacterium]